MAFCSDPIHGSLSHAQFLFETIENPSLCIWNTLMKSLLLRGEHTKTINIYGRMLQNGFCPDNYTLPYLLKACANLKDIKIGKLIHSHVLKLGLASDIFVNNTLILMYMTLEEAIAARKVFNEVPLKTDALWTIMISGYAKMGEIELARSVFDEALVKDRGIWGSMIYGYLQNNCFKECLLMFRLMQIEGIKPDEGVFVSVLCACAQLGAIDIGTWIHHYLNQKGVNLSVRLGTALIDMYMKCGSLNIAQQLFHRISKKDTICWNVMLLGVAMHANGKDALKLFSKMQVEGFKPDETTFLAMLSACSHTGLIKEGLTVFDSMKSTYNIEPCIEHYICIVDFLGRSRHFKEAMKIIEKMPKSSSVTEKAVAWRALLSACQNHGDIKFAEVAAEEIMILQGHSGAYVLLSNIYEKHGRYEDARFVRKSMRDKGVVKKPGCSSIEICGYVHEFTAGEKVHRNMDEVHQVLEALSYHLGKLNTVPCL